MALSLSGTGNGSINNLTVPTASGAVVGSGTNYPLNIDSSATANSIHIDSSGNVLKPNQTGCFANLPSGTRTNYTNGNISGFYTNVVRDAGGDLSAGIFTAPVDGFYVITFQFGTEQNTSGVVDINVNGVGRVSRVGREGSESYSNRFTACAVVYMDANDYVEVLVNSGTIQMGTLVSSGLGHFAVALIG